MATEPAWCAKHAFASCIGTTSENSVNINVRKSFFEIQRSSLVSVQLEVQNNAARPGSWSRSCSNGEASRAAGRDHTLECDMIAAFV